MKLEQKIRDPEGSLASGSVPPEARDEAGLIGTHPRQPDRAPTQMGLTRGLMFCCCLLEMLNFGIKILLLHSALGPENKLSHPERPG